MPTALVTGAGVRLGSAIATQLAAKGFDLVLHAHRSVEALEELALALRARGRKVACVAADLAQPEGIEALAAAVEQHGGVLEVLVNNAGIFEQVPFADITRAAYQRMQAINLEAPFFLTQRLLPALQRGQSPCVVNLTDIGGERAVNRYAHYSVSKAGLIMLTRALAVELAPRVRVNAVSPGTVAFPEDFGPEEKAAHLVRVPMGREGRVEDVADTVVFLATGAPYLTGQVVAVDGGRSAQL